MDNLINILIENNKELIENINRNNKELTTSILSLKNGNETNLSIETYKKEIEEKDNRIKTLQDEINKIQDEVSTLVEKKDIEIENLKEENNKLQESLNKVTVTTNGKETSHSSSTSIEDKILTYQLNSVTEHPTKDKAWKQEQQEKALQEAKQEQSPKVDTKTTVQENNYKEVERNYALKKLENDLIKPFKEMIINTKNYEKLMKAQEEFVKSVNKFYTVHQDEITLSDIKPFTNELRIVFQQKEEELEPKVNTKIEKQEDNSKEGETNSNRFQSIKETTPKTENCEEKKETTAEPSTANSKNIEVSNFDTSDNKETQEKQIDEEVSTKNGEEVKFPETKVIPLREGEEKRQFQELVANQTLNQMLESYSEKRNFDEILTEIRKIVTNGNYPKRIVNAYLNYAWDTYRFDCNLQDATEPLEDTKEDKETTAETTSTPKGDNFEKFKESLDNIEKNAEENGNELPFGNNQKSNHQDVDESNYYQSEEEKVAMSATCSYDETQDAVF